MNAATVSKDNCREFGNGLYFNVTPKYRYLLSFVVLFTALGSTPASAYQFGPPPITELAEAGKTQNRFSVYSQTTVFEGTALDPTLRGISVASSTGDSTGSRTGMFRLAQYSDKRTSPGYNALTDSTGMLIGGGFGGQWNFGESRNFGVLLDGQMDFLTFKYDITGSSVTNNQFAFGLEGGAFYRFFVDVATITPFVTAMKGMRNRDIVYSSTAIPDVKYNYADSGTTIGIDFMMGKFAASVLRTNASYVATRQGGAALPAQKTTITMLVLGINF